MQGIKMGWFTRQSDIFCLGSQENAKIWNGGRGTSHN